MAFSNTGLSNATLRLVSTAGTVHI